MWQALSLRDVFSQYQQHVTIGQNIGQPGCGIPDCGIEWITTAPPLYLDSWPMRPSTGRTFTSIASWRGSYGPVTYGGTSYGLRVHEFRKFAQLPRATGCEFELAMDLPPAEIADRFLLEENGWKLTDPRGAARDPWTYQHYLMNSGAEFMVAKNMYVATAGGWFSDRSACYLATGRPVLAQDTGFVQRYPAECGLLSFRTFEEAQAGVEKIMSDYISHSKAAREMATEYFDSDKVLSRLVDELG
jgi:hypothetical protein